MELQGLTTPVTPEAAKSPESAKSAKATKAATVTIPDEFLTAPDVVAARVDVLASSDAGKKLMRATKGALSLKEGVEARAREIACAAGLAVDKQLTKKYYVAANMGM
jgi:hypothetical protein